MGKEPNRLGPTEEAAQLEGEIERVRGELDTLVTELDRRRHALTNLPLQLERHWRLGLGALVAVLAAVGGGIALWAFRGRVRARPTAKLWRLRRALSRAIERPERVAREPTVPVKLLVAAGSSVAQVAAGSLTRRLLEARPA
ncbi:MAG: hypothetical protein ACYCWW_19785 [Deltaproteobacteria bacterium]